MKDNDTQATSSITAAFDKLTSTYARMLDLCHDALGPGKTQVERNRVRDAVQEYVKADGGGEKE